jgi:hypothetical protein
MKRCYKCKKIKPLSEFVNHKNKPQGKANICVLCHRIICRKYYRSHKDDYRLRAKHHLDKARIIAKRSYHKNRKLILKRALLRSGKFPWISHYEAARQRCLNPNNKCYNSYGGRGIKFSLTINEVRRLWIRDKADALIKPSIDRKNNDGNYTFKNCRFIEQIKNLSGSKSGYHPVRT